MARGSATTTETPVFIINNTDLQLKKEVVNIAKRLGIPYSQALRDVIKKWRDSYSDDYRKPMKD